MKKLSPNKMLVLKIKEVKQLLNAFILDPDNMCDFTVKVNKVGSTHGLLFEAVTMDTSININQVHHSENINDYYNNLTSGKNISDLYMGPDFSTLDEVFTRKLQHIKFNRDYNNLLWNF